MSLITTGVSAITAEEAGLTCSGYYSDTKYVDFTSDGKVAVIQNGEELGSLPLTGVNFPVDMFSSGTVTLKAGSDPKTIDASMCGDKHLVRQLSDIYFTYSSVSPAPAKFRFVVSDAYGNETATDYVDIDGTETSSEFVELLKTAISNADLDLNDVEVVDFSEGTVTLRTCVEGEEQTYKIEYYDSAGNLIGTDYSETTRPGVSYDAPRPSFIIVMLEYADSASSSSGCSCKSSSCGSSTSTKCGSSSSDNDDDDTSDRQKTIAWTNLDLYERFKDEDDNSFIWDRVGDILVHSGGMNIDEDDDNSVKPIVLWNDSGVDVTAKIMMAH